MLQEARNSETYRTTLLLNYSGIRHLSDSDLEDDDYKNARCLYLKRNLLKQLPGSIGQLTALMQLHVPSNELDSLPEEIGGLRDLELLDVSGNRLVGLPATIGKLENLRKLCVSDNRISCIPKEIGCLQKLRTLEASRNLLTSVPMELSSCRRLELLALDKNLLTTVPRQLGKLRMLLELSLCGNYLEYIPQSMACMQSLKVLYLDNNPAFSTFPQAWSFSRYINIGLHGCYQTDVQLCERFKHIYVNNMHVTLPEEIQQVCIPGEACVASLQELTLRTISGCVRNSNDVYQLPLPVSFKESLADPCAICDKCSTNLFHAAFPAVFVHFANQMNMLGLFCSLDCVNSFFNGFKMIYPFKKDNSDFRW